VASGKGDNGRGGSLDEMADALVGEAIDAARISAEDAPRYRQEWYQELFGSRQFILERRQEIRERIRQMPERPTMFGRLDEAAFRRRFPKAKWEQYAGYVTVSIHEAVALSCDVDPARIRPFGEIFPEYGRRLGVVVNNAKSGRLRLQEYDDMNPPQSVVDLAVFVSWVMEHPETLITLPQGFPGAVSAPASRPGPASSEQAKERSLHPKERISLLVIIGALAKKAGVDLDHPSSAAKEIERVAREDLRAEISVGTVAAYLKDVEDALDQRAIDRKD
jgi:hypothetical protein